MVVYWQIILNAMVTAAPISLLAVGFALIFRVAGFYHFTHGSVFMAAPYFAMALQIIGFPLFSAIILGVLASAVFGLVLGQCLFLPARRRGASGLVLLFISLGAALVIQNVIALAFGDSLRVLRPHSTALSIPTFGALVTPTQILQVSVAAAVGIGAALYLRYSRSGRAMRAVASNPELAGFVNLPVDRIGSLAFLLGSFLAAIAGALFALDTPITPTMGSAPLLLAIVAVIAGGAYRTPGILIAALVISLVQHFVGWFWRAEWRDPVALALLVLVLLLQHPRHSRVPAGQVYF